MESRTCNLSFKCAYTVLTVAGQGMTCSELQMPQLWWRRNVTTSVMVWGSSHGMTGSELQISRRHWREICTRVRWVRLVNHGTVKEERGHDFAEAFR